MSAPLNTDVIERAKLDKIVAEAVTKMGVDAKEGVRMIAETSKQLDAICKYGRFFQDPKDALALVQADKQTVVATPAAKTPTNG